MHGFAIVVWLLLAAIPVQARWLRAETPSFVVYSQGSEESLRKQAEQLQAYDALLRTVTGVKAPPSPTRVNVIIARDTSLFYHFNVGADYAGVYIASTGGIFALVGRYEAYWRDNDTSVLFHEYAHHFMLQYAASSYPRWYTEGFAQYLMSTRIKDGVAEIGRFDSGDAFMLKDNAWMTFESLIDPRPNRGRSSRSDMFYPQAWIAVHYINADAARRQALARYLAALAKGADPLKGFETAFGMTLQQFQTALFDYSRSSNIGYQRLTWSPPPAQITISPMPVSADQLLILDFATRADISRAGSRLLDEVRRAAATAPPGDVYAETALLRAEAHLGEVQPALALLSAALATRPDDAELLYLRGVALHRAASAKDLDPAQAAALRKTARITLARAHQLAPDDYRILFGHTIVAEKPLSDSEYDVAKRALDLAPQVSDIALATARYEIERNDVVAARALLQRIAANTHKRAAAIEAAEMLAKLDAPNAAR